MRIDLNKNSLSFVVERVGGWSESNLVAILASAVAYLGVAAGLVVAMLMGLAVFIGDSGQPIVSRKVVPMAQVPSEITVATNTKSSKSAISRRDARSASGIRRTHTGAVTSRGQPLYILDGKERPRRLAYRKKSDFEARYLSYIDVPSADLSVIR